MKFTFKQIAPLLTFVFGVVFVLPLLQAQDSVGHHLPREPHYLSTKTYETFKKQVPPPPAMGSEAQKKDEEELVRLQASRSKNDCVRATAEVHVSVESFFGRPYGSLSAPDAKAIDPFFAQLRVEGAYFVDRLKLEYARKRPYLYIPGLTPCVQKEITDAYPSGHAFMARVFALVLTELYPNSGLQFQKRAQEVAHDRILGGVHHPSDIKAGRTLADLFYAEIKKSAEFQADLATLRNALSKDGSKN